MAEPCFADETLCTCWLRLGQEWRRWQGTGNLLRMAEVMQIMALTATDGQRHRKCLPTSASTTDALLVIEPLRWHVRLKDGAQRSDVDPHLHGRCHGQHVNQFFCFVDGVGWSPITLILYGYR